MRKPVQTCDYCGEYIDRTERWGNEPVTCGKPACERWARDEEAGMREEAHRRLDEDMGWDR